MRLSINFFDEKNIFSPEVNQIPPWPAWYPGKEWLHTHYPIMGGVLVIVNYWYVSIAITALYLLGIWWGQRAMAGRRPMNLKWTLVAWNLGLAIFSAIGSYQAIPAIIYALYSGGYTRLVCDFPVHDRAHLIIWGQLFALSKVIEFGDTAFLVLRKRPVIPLHWIHHSVTCVGCFYGSQFFPALSLQLGGINYTIHTVMYAYFAAVAAGIRIPKRWAAWITRIQIAQMFTDMWATLWAYYISEYTERPCYNHPALMNFIIIILAVFTVLFVQFFIRSYVLKVKIGRMPAKDQAQSKGDQKETTKRHDYNHNSTKNLKAQ